MWGYIILAIMAIFCFSLAMALSIEKHTFVKRNKQLNEQLAKFGFIINKEIKANTENIVSFDNQNRTVAVKVLKSGKRLKVVHYKYADILSFELVENGNTTYETRVEGGLTRAIIGGAMFGGVGAIVGANTARQNTTSTTTNTYQIRLTINDFNNPNIIIDCKDKETAQEIYATFEVIKYNN